jgi:hypothetical protein
MTPEAQRIAIAEACGWRTQPDSQGKRWEDTSALEDGWFYESELPDYLTDLNACAEFEATLTAEEYSAYHHVLVHDICAHPSSVRPLSATAAQRCEAFLRTIGKWNDSL